MDYNIEIVPNSGIQDAMYYELQSKQKLTDFYAEHPEITHQSSKLTIDIIRYGLEIMLETKFLVKLEGDAEACVVTATWEDENYGCRYDDDFESVYGSPTYNPECIPQLGKWYRLTDNIRTSLDVALHEGHKDEAIRLLQEKVNTLEMNRTLQTLATEQWRKHTQLLRQDIANSNKYWCHIL